MNAARAAGLLLALSGTVCGAAPPSAAPPAAPPLLAWADDPPATEVRPLSGDRTIKLRYGAALDPATFHATLDDERVTPSFKPEPGTSETVTLDFIGGRNHLVIQGRSADGLQHITLERWISFARFPGDENASGRLRSAPELKQEVWKQKTPQTEPAAAPTTKP